MLLMKTVDDTLVLKAVFVSLQLASGYWTHRGPLVVENPRERFAKGAIENSSSPSVYNSWSLGFGYSASSVLQFAVDTSPRFSLFGIYFHLSSLENLRNTETPGSATFWPYTFGSFRNLSIMRENSKLKFWKPMWRTYRMWRWLIIDIMGWGWFLEKIHLWKSKWSYIPMWTTRRNLLET